MTDRRLCFRCSYTFFNAKKITRLLQSSQSSNPKSPLLFNWSGKASASLFVHFFYPSSNFEMITKTFVALTICIETIYIWKITGEYFRYFTFFYFIKRSNLQFMITNGSRSIKEILWYLILFHYLLLGFNFNDSILYEFEVI